MSSRPSGSPTAAIVGSSYRLFKGSRITCLSGRPNLETNGAGAYKRECTYWTVG